MPLYAIGLGGTNFRVLRVEVGVGSVIVNQKVEIQAIHEELMGTSQVLVLLYYFYVCMICFCYMSLSFISAAGFIQLCCLDTKE